MVVQRPHGDPRRIDSEWTRVDPFTRVYPRDAWGFAEPGLVKNTDASSRDDFPYKTVRNTPDLFGANFMYTQTINLPRKARDK